MTRLASYLRIEERELEGSARMISGISATTTTTPVSSDPSTAPATAPPRSAEDLGHLVKDWPSERSKWRAGRDRRARQGEELPGEGTRLALRAYADEGSPRRMGVLAHPSVLALPTKPRIICVTTEGLGDGIYRASSGGRRTL